MGASYGCMSHSPVPRTKESGLASVDDRVATAAAVAALTSHPLCVRAPMRKCPSAADHMPTTLAHVRDLDLECVPRRLLWRRLLRRISTVCDVDRRSCPRRSCPRRARRMRARGMREAWRRRVGRLRAAAAGRVGKSLREEGRAADDELDGGGFGGVVGNVEGLSLPSRARTGNKDAKSCRDGK